MNRTWILYNLQWSISVFEVNLLWKRSAFCFCHVIVIFILCYSYHFKKEFVSLLRDQCPLKFVRNVLENIYVVSWSNVIFTENVNWNDSTSIRINSPAETLWDISRGTLANPIALLLFSLSYFILVIVCVNVSFYCQFHVSPTLFLLF